MSALGTYLLYYFIVISSSIIAWFSNFIRNKEHKKLAKWIFFIAIIIPVLVSGFRYGIGTDYHAYVNMYYNITNNYYGISDAISNTRYEPGWIILNYIVKYVFDDVNYIFVLSALLTWSFIFKAIYDNKDRLSIGIAVLILLCTMYSMSFNIVRQILAVSIIMLSVKPMLDQKKWKFIFTILFASTFHFTAILFLVSYWIINSKTENRRLLKRLFMPVMFIGLVVFFQPITSYLASLGLLSNYSSYGLDAGGFSRSTFFFKLPIVVVMLFSIRNLRLQNNAIHKMSILFYIGVIMLLLSTYSPYLSRLSYFFDVAQIFVISALVKHQKNKYQQFFFVYLIIIYYLGWFTYFYLIVGNGGTIPYQSL